MPKTSKSSNKVVKSRSIKANQSAKRSVKNKSVTKRRVISKKTKSSKKAKIDLGYLTKSFAAALTALAVIVGAQFVDIDNKSQVAGIVSGNGQGRVYMIIPDEVKIGDVVRAEVWSNSNEPINAVQADLVYSDSLEYIKVDDSGSAFDVDPPVTNKDNMVKLPKGTLTPLENEQMVGVVEFKAVKVGSALITFSDSTKLLTSKGNQNIAGVPTDYSLNIIGE